VRVVGRLHGKAVVLQTEVGVDAAGSPRRIQARREVNELPDRELMRDGRWLI
jgi:hypothetical protein